MAQNQSGQEKTEEATPRRLQKAREDGQVPKSMEVNTTLLLIAGVVSFYFFGNDFVRQNLNNLEYFFDLSYQFQLNSDTYYHIFLEVGLRVLYIVAPFMIVLVITALVVNFGQVGFMFVGKPLLPDLNRINPQKGIERIFGPRGRVELLKSVFKIFLIAPVMIFLIYRAFPIIVTLTRSDAHGIIETIAWLALEIAIYALLILLILAIADYIFQRYQHTQDLKMTKEEVKQEMKDVQGDPQVKSRIRSIQQEMSRRRMMEEVPESDVVVTNPTEYAIALRYQSDIDAAPVVVAKGRNHLARNIREIADTHRVPIVENRPLAQSLYKLVEVGQLIPPELYKAVSEVLAYVYRLTGKFV